ncbi:MAG: hypothetical protein GXO90_00445 [FCB group bacterium]|nr:hypothetical protein [FCB group bacterium]
MEIERRKFIKNATFASIGLFLYGCGNYVRIPIRKWPDNSALSLWQKIFYYASLAPSGHNTQPWLVELNSKDEFIIKINAESWLPAVDPEHRETYLSMGAFLENLILSARSLGMDLAYEVISESTSDLHVISGSFSKSSGKEKNLQVMAKRRTIRSGFLKQELSEADIQSCISNTAEANYYPINSAQSGIIDDVTYSANETQVNRKATQIELAKWIRWSNEEAREKKDGLTPAGMDITGLPGFIVRTFYNEKQVTSDSFKRQTLKKVKEQLAQHGGWIVITSPNSDPGELIETGRILEQILLRASARNIAIHPMSQALEEFPFKNEIAHNLGISQIPQFLLRVGYLGSEYPAPVSLRRPVDSFLKMV